MAELPKGIVQIDIMLIMYINKSENSQTSIYTNLGVCICVCVCIYAHVKLYIYANITCLFIFKASTSLI